MDAASTTLELQPGRDGGVPCSALLPGQFVTIKNGDSRTVLKELAPESIQCCVTKLFASFFQLQCAKITKDFIRRALKFWRQSFPTTRRRKPPAQRIHFKAQLNAAFLTLNKRQGRSKKLQTLFLTKAKPVIRRSAILSDAMNHLSAWQNGVNKLNRFPVGHGNFKPDDVARTFASRLKRFLNPDVCFGINHRGQISYLPLFQCFGTIHTQ